MPCEIIWEHKGVLKRLSGHVSADEFVRSVEAIQADPRFDDIRYVINDFSHVSSHELDADLLQELAAIQYGAQASNPQVRAVYAGLKNDPELAQLLQSILIGSKRSVYRVALFDTLPQARDWLQGEMRSAWRSGLGTRASTG
ncbi:hypothetical protein [Malikia granosa]|uniref:STAS/SEC14 domain-containing protein n=1 Tax=Malikia granosa TaxID=263067 RepID=A0A2S9K8C0_9BURK|nr:hypothetical protein [Malikia granosa]PRD66657.1 hypothetical protein C6P64_03065 [Malikia granosa]